MQAEMTASGCPLIVFGTRNGGIGAIELTRDEAIVLWETESVFDTKSAVYHIKVAQLASVNYNIVVTREDGLIEIFTYNQKN
jgi:hypothetical protein